MGRVAMEFCTAVTVGLLFPAASAAFDYQNVLDEDIAMYVLIGIAVIYFIFTGFLLILAVCCCCRQKSERKTKPFLDSKFKRAHKPTLATIPEESAFTEQDPQHHVRGSHRRLTRLRSDEEELLGHDEPSQPPSPTDTTAMGTMPQPISRTPDPRRKKAAQDELRSQPDTRVPPRLPGAASPLEKTPETQRKTLPRVTNKTTLPPLRNTPPLGRKMESESVGGIAGSLGPIQRVPNKRLESPRMQRRNKQPTSPPDIAMSSLATADSHVAGEPNKTPTTSEKKAQLDTSFVVENKGFSDGEPSVQLLELQRQLRPISHSWHQIGLEVKLSHFKLTLCGQASSEESRLQRVCQAWLQAEPELSWEEVVKVLRCDSLEGQTAEVVREIEKRLCRDPLSDTPKSEHSITFL